MLGGMSKKIVDFPKVTLIAVLTIIIIGLSGAVNLWQTIDYKIYYSTTDPLRIALDELESDFTTINNAFVIFAPKNGDVFDANFLDLIHQFSKDAWQIPYSKRVSSITNYLYSYGEDGSLVLEPILESPLNKSVSEIEAAKQNLLADKNIVGRLLSDRAHVTAVDIGLQLPNNPVSETREVTAYIRDILVKYQLQYPDVAVHLTGSAFADEVMAVASERDMALLVPLTYTVIIVLLYVLLRSFGAMAITLIVISLATGFAFGVKGFYNGAISPVSLLTPFMIMTIAVADCVHIFVTAFQKLRGGVEKKEAVLESLQQNFKPVFLTSITTAIGFLGLNLSESPAISDFGNIVALGVLAAFVLSVTLLPALMLLLPFKTPKKDVFGSNLMAPIANLVISSPKLVLASVLVFSLALISGVTKNEINEIFIDFFDDTFEFRVANKFYDANLSGFHRAEYSIGSKGENGINDPEYLNNLEAFGEWLRQQPEVAHVNLYTDTIKRLNKNMHDDDPNHFAIPETRQLAAQYLLLYKMSFPFGYSVDDRISIDNSKTRVTVKLWLSDSETILAFNNRSLTWLQDNTPAYMHSVGVGVDIMFSKTALNNIEAMYYGAFIVLVMISITLFLNQKSLKVGLVSLLPNLFPALMAYGLWGMLVGRIGLGEAIVASLTLGLVVDDTVHFLTKYLAARKDRGMNAEQAVSYAFNTVGVSLFVTTIIFAAGFGVLSFSHYNFNANMGALTAITICFALLIDFLLLPAILILLNVGEKKSKMSDLEAGKISA